MPAKLTKLLVLGFERGNSPPQLSAAKSPWDDFVSLVALCRRRKDDGDSVGSGGHNYLIDQLGKPEKEDKEFGV